MADVVPSTFSGMIELLYANPHALDAVREEREKQPIIREFYGKLKAETSARTEQYNDWNIMLDERISTGRQGSLVARPVSASETPLRFEKYYTASDVREYSYALDMQRVQTIISDGGEEMARNRFLDEVMTKEKMAEEEWETDLANQLYYGTGLNGYQGMFTLIGGVGATNVTYSPKFDDGSRTFMGLLRFESPADQVSNSASFQGLTRSVGSQGSGTSKYWYNYFDEPTGWAHAQRVIDANMVEMSKRNSKYGTKPNWAVVDSITYLNMASALGSRAQFDVGSATQMDGVLKTKKPEDSTIEYRGIKFWADPMLSLTSLDTALGGLVPSVLNGVAICLNMNAFRKHDTPNNLTAHWRGKGWVPASDPLNPDSVIMTKKESNQIYCHDLASQMVLTGLGLG